MTYVDGFVIPVPVSSKDEYCKHADEGAALFKEFGVGRIVESWADDVPDGAVTDFRKAVNATADETVVFSWFEYPSRETREAAVAKMMSDPRMSEMSMPFDGQRMIMGGFESLLDEGGGETAGYTDGFLVPVPAANKEAYREMATKAAAVFREYGATRVVEAWGDDVRDGKVTDFRRAVKAEEGEAVVFSWIEWPSKESRVENWEKIMKDPRMQPDFANMPFDGKRMIYGGFAPILEA
jgi:uncharacterized protein YbaA (DUF1428 family)